MARLIVGVRPVPSVVIVFITLFGSPLYEISMVAFATGRLLVDDSTEILNCPVESAWFLSSVISEESGGAMVFSGIVSEASGVAAGGMALP